jgi:hypothetical protein
MSDKIIQLSPKEEAAFDRIFRAIVQVESGGNLKAVGDNGQAIGPAQIHMAYVRDAQDVDPGITPDMRWTLEGSKRIMRAYMIRHKVPLTNAEMVARVHNGGPQGYLKPATLVYWKKVKNALNALK